MKRVWTLSVLFLAGLWAVSQLSAGFLPLWFDLPKRDNPNDPFAKRQDTLNPGLPSPTPVPLCGGADDAYWHFESTVQNWNGSPASIYYDAMSTALSSASFCKGAQSLGGTVTFTSIGKATFQSTVSLPFAGNFTGKNLTAWIMFPSGLPAGTTAKMYIITTGGYVFAEGPIVNAPSGGGWAQLTLNVTTVIGTYGGNAGQVNQVGVEIYTGTAGGPFSFNLDSVEIFPPPPTATPSHTALGTFTATPTFSASRTPTQTANGTFTATPTASPSPTPIPTCGGAGDTTSWNFEATQQGWTGSAASGFYDAMTASLSTSTFCRGAQSMSGTVTFTAIKKATFLMTSGFPYSGDFTGRTITGWVYFPAGLPVGTTAKLYIKTTGSYTFANGPAVNAPGGGGWALVTIDCNAAVSTYGGDTAQVMELGIEVFAGAVGGPFTFYWDAVDIQ